MSVRRLIRAGHRRVTTKPRAHFLHVNKTGGSAITNALRPLELAGSHHLVFKKKRTLRDIPEGEWFFFGVRDPISRFISGFYSRQLQGGIGRPRPWRVEEAPVFNRFTTPNELAEALFSDPAAEDAMGAIRHFRSYWSWFRDEDYLLRRSDRLLMVLFQEQLDDDFALLTQHLGLNASLPTDDLTAHRNPATVDLRLTDAAVVNLRRWYQRDYDFVDLCRYLRS